MRTDHEHTPARRPRASILAAAVIFGLAVVGCAGADGPAAAGDNRPSNLSADPGRPAAQTSSPGPAASPGAGDPAAGEAGGANANAGAGTNAGANTNEAGPGGAAAEDEGASPQDFEGTAGVTEKKREMSGAAVLRRVRTASHAGYERVVFEFDGDAPPGYHVEYVDRPVRQCGSGRPVRVAGDGWLLVRLEPANAHTEAGEPTVKERERRPGYRNLKEMKLICDFEAQVEWVLGVASPNRYRVLELRNPARLVVDVKR